MRGWGDLGPFGALSDHYLFLIESILGFYHSPVSFSFLFVCSNVPLKFFLDQIFFSCSSLSQFFFILAKREKNFRPVVPLPFFAEVGVKTVSAHLSVQPSVAHPDSYLTF